LWWIIAAVPGTLADINSLIAGAITAMKSQNAGN